MSDGSWFKSGGFVNGTDYYFVVTALVGVNESVESDTVGPVTINASTGNYSVSGTVSFPGVTPTGPLFVGVYSEMGITYTRYTAPSSGQAYTISGVPNGTYMLFAIIDMDNDGIIDVGDLSNTEGKDNGTITVNGANLTGQTVTIPTANGVAGVTTEHRKQGTNENYNVDMEVISGRKMVVAVAVASGPGINSITDLSRQDWTYDYWINRGLTRPTTADTYTFNVTYSDGTTGILTA